jgi:hypothetical protein
VYVYLIRYSLVIRNIDFQTPPGKGRFIRNYTVVPKYCGTTIFESGRILFPIIRTPQNVNIRIFIVTYVVVSYEETEVVASQFFSSTKPYDTVGVYFDFCCMVMDDGY